MLKDWIINLLLDGIRIPSGLLHEWIDAADTDGDGDISLREVYDRYRKWKDE